MLIEIPNATSKSNLDALSIANIGVAFSSTKFFCFLSFFDVIILTKGCWCFLFQGGKI